jgi:hypothetical protein
VVIFGLVGEVCLLEYKSETCTYEVYLIGEGSLLEYKSETCTYEFSWSGKVVCWSTSRKLVHTSLAGRGRLSVGVQVGNLYIRV